ncbi:MAG TPA: TonB family protein [Burkholderiales bacterium]|nr:TonB family protein [Burkholderiales bacterium]
MGFVREDEGRLFVALVVSAALHASLIIGVTVRSPSSPGAMRALQVHLQRAFRPDIELTPLAPPHAPIPDLTTRASKPRRVTPREPKLRPEAQDALAAATPSSLDAGRDAALEAASQPPTDSETPLPSVDIPLLSDPTWYTAKDLDVYPTPRHDVRPRYPSDANGEDVVGEVTVELSIDESGHVHEIGVVAAEPPGRFENAALAAFEGIEFQPGMREGRSVRSRVLVKIRFNPDPPLTDPSAKNP